jgi:hypothetical protein
MLACEHLCAQRDLGSQVNKRFQYDQQVDLHMNEPILPSTTSPRDCHNHNHNRDSGAARAMPK